MGIVLGLFTICRLGFYLFNISLFPEVPLSQLAYILLAGLRFDISAVLYTNVLFIVLMILPLRVRFTALYQRIVRWIFYITNSAALAANVADFIYFRFTLRRTTYDVFAQFENESNLGTLTARFFLDYWYAAIFWAALVFLLVWSYKRVKLHGPMIGHSIMFYSSSIVAIPLVIFVFIGGVKGGFFTDRRPITLTDAGEYVKDPKAISLVLNTPFCIYRTTGKTQIQKVHYFKDQKDAEQIFSPVHIPSETESFRKENVMIIIMESFSKEFTRKFNAELEDGKYKGYTPFLDSLMEHSTTFEYSFANGRKSIDALPSVITSIPNMGLHYVLSPFSSNKVNSIASLLKSKGYTSAFFHGAPNGSMGFESFMNISGFDHYYGMTEYNNEEDYDGYWGIWDHKFFSYTADRLNDFEKPFVSVLFSLSSHHPFSVPAVFEEHFKGGPVPLQRCIQYGDHSLRLFFEKASRMPWYNNTLFVITADHTSLSQFNKYQTESGLYSVPIVFFKPDNSLRHPEPLKEIVQHVDIMPTVLDYLNYDEPFVAFGRSAFDKTSEPRAFHYKNNAYHLFQDSTLLVFDGNKTTGVYDFRNDPSCSVNIADRTPEKTKMMEDQMKAIIQSFNNRMVENKLLPGPDGTTHVTHVSAR
jgi:phosphoglycerol transferase MdoB-like AlkP superfamily enzyme